jgi:MinD superfamily P-loop ATPase
MKIAVASGKGGTGKTLISTNLFNVITDSVYLDCDVEEPNGHIFLRSKIEKSDPVHILVPKIDTAKCTNCGRCAEVCQFNALIVTKEKVLLFHELCHGCGSCSYFCPEQAISEKPREIGKIEQSSFNKKTVFTGRLNIGEPMAPPVIRKLKENINNNEQVFIIDAPPGTSCPVIESLKNTDYIILVTEPTPFGLNDLKLAVAVVRKLKIPMGIVVNKSGLGGNLIKDYCQTENIKLLLEIPHANEIAVQYSKGELISNKEEYKNIFEKLFSDIKLELGK